MRSELEWIRLQARTMYVFDGAGRLLKFNEPEGKVVDCPIVFLGRSRLGNVFGIRHDVPDALARELEAMLEAEPAHADEARPRQADALRRRIEMFAPVRIEFSGPAFHFGDGARMPAPGPGQLRVLAPEEAPKVSAAFPRLAASVASRTPIVAMLEDDRVLSACYAATGPGPAVEAGVDTVDAARGRGFAPRVVAAWAAEVRAAGRIPLYSTAWTNTASRAVARKLELVPYGTDWHLR